MKEKREDSFGMIRRPDFKNKKMNPARLLSFGFTEKEGGYFYSAPVAGGQFEMTVHISGAGSIHADVMDKPSGEKYILHLIPGTGGAFISGVREEYESILTAISETCFDTDFFQSDQAEKVLQYVKEKYNDRPEYLWPKYPGNAVLRRKDNSKWYAALLLLSKSKLGIESEEPVEIIDLRINTQETATLVDGRRYFPGYHMNKKNWITICLDGSVALEEILQRIDTSYDLANKKTKVKV